MNVLYAGMFLQLLLCPDKFGFYVKNVEQMNILLIVKQSKY